MTEAQFVILASKMIHRLSSAHGLIRRQKTIINRLFHLSENWYNIPVPESEVDILDISHHFVNYWIKDYTNVNKLFTTRVTSRII